MDARRFILDELKEFIKHFTKTRVRYEYDSYAMVHIIEVLPNEIYHLDKDYIEWENSLYNCFVDFFPTENICFISDDAMVGIESPELVLEGLEYAPITSEKEFQTLFTTEIIQGDNSCYYNITSLDNSSMHNFEKSEMLPNSIFDNYLLNAA